MYCGNCGQEIPDEARFCPYCGTKVDWVPMPAAAPAPVPAGTPATAAAAGSAPTPIPVSTTAPTPTPAPAATSAPTRASRLAALPLAAKIGIGVAAVAVVVVVGVVVHDMAADDGQATPQKVAAQDDAGLSADTSEDASAVTEAGAAAADADAAAGNQAPIEEPAAPTPAPSATAAVDGWWQSNGQSGNALFHVHDGKAWLYQNSNGRGGWDVETGTWEVAKTFDAVVAQRVDADPTSGQTRAGWKMSLDDSGTFDWYGYDDNDMKDGQLAYLTYVFLDESAGIYRVSASNSVERIDETDFLRNLVAQSEDGSSSGSTDSQKTAEQPAAKASTTQEVDGWWQQEGDSGNTMVHICEGKAWYYGNQSSSQMGWPYDEADWVLTKTFDSVSVQRVTTDPRTGNASPGLKVSLDGSGNFDYYAFDDADTEGGRVTMLEYIARKDDGSYLYSGSSSRRRLDDSDFLRNLAARNEG